MILIFIHKNLSTRAQLTQYYKNTSGTNNCNDYYHQCYIIMLIKIIRSEDVCGLSSNSLLFNQHILFTFSESS